MRKSLKGGRKSQGQKGADKTISKRSGVRRARREEESQIQAEDKWRIGRRDKSSASGLEKGKEVSKKESARRERNHLALCGRREKGWAVPAEKCRVEKSSLGKKLKERVGGR